MHHCLLTTSSTNPLGPRKRALHWVHVADTHAGLVAIWAADPTFSWLGGSAKSCATGLSTPTVPSHRRVRPESINRCFWELLQVEEATMRRQIVVQLCFRFVVLSLLRSCAEALVVSDFFGYPFGEDEENTFPRVDDTSLFINTSIQFPYFQSFYTGISVSYLAVKLLFCYVVGWVAD